MSTLIKYLIYVPASKYTNVQCREYLEKHFEVVCFMFLPIVNIFHAKKQKKVSNSSIKWYCKGLVCLNYRCCTNDCLKLLHSTLVCLNNLYLTAKLASLAILQFIACTNKSAKIDNTLATLQLI